MDSFYIWTGKTFGQHKKLKNGFEEARFLYFAISLSI